MDNGTETPPPLTKVGHTKENEHKRKRQAEAEAGQERGGKHRHVQEIRNKRWGRNRRVRKRTKGKSGHTQRTVGHNIGHVNINGRWRYRKQEIEDWAKVEELDIVGVVETHCAKTEMSLEGFKSFSIGENRELENRLGISIFVREELKPFEIETNSLTLDSSKEDSKWVGVVGGEP